MLEQEQFFKYLEYMAEKIPCAVYWLNTNYIGVGVNEKLLKAIGASSRDNVIGKTVYDFYPKHIADGLQGDFKLAVESGQESEHEHIIEDITTGKTRYFAATVSPLRDNHQKIIGIIGTSIEITAEKEKERLELENRAQQVTNDEQKKFREFISQIVHDLRSPVASVQKVLQIADSIPEAERVTLLSATQRINDISEHMLAKYNNPDKVYQEKKHPLLVAATVQQILSEKRYEYYDRKIRFELQFMRYSEFPFINVNQEKFKRMISNLINNAVDAVKHKTRGIIKISLNGNYPAMGTRPALYSITISDNGNGMSRDTAIKIEHGEVITGQKAGGHGLGLQQVHDTLQDSAGSITVESWVDGGTQVTITLPQVKPPAWFTSEIKIFEDALVVILDDDDSIHNAWDLHFQSICQELPQVRIHHFRQGSKALELINKLTPEQKKRTCFLCDYELLYDKATTKQNGIDIIKAAQIKRSILVTSYGDKPKLQRQAVKLGIKIISKDLVSKITISLDKKLIPNSRKVDVVWVDDALIEIEPIIFSKYPHLKVDIYNDPLDFLEKFDQYPRDTRMILDYHFYYDYDERCKTMNGVTVAKVLHEHGYTNLCLCSYEPINKQQKLPKYLKFVLKERLIRDNTLYPVLKD